MAIKTVLEDQRKPQFKKTHAPQCSPQHYLQQPGHGSNLNVSQQRDKEDVVPIDNRTVLSHKKIVSFAETWVDLETVLQTEVKSEENKCRILKYIWGI